MLCEECKSCHIKVLCDEVDSIIEECLTLNGKHDVLMAIYEKGRSNAIDEFVEKADSTILQDYYNSDVGKYGIADVAKTLRIVAEQLKEKNK